jgi:hypothetical protein
MTHHKQLYRNECSKAEILRVCVNACVKERERKKEIYIYIYKERERERQRER